MLWVELTDWLDVSDCERDWDGVGLAVTVCDRDWLPVWVCDGVLQDDRVCVWLPVSVSV